MSEQKVSALRVAPMPATVDELAKLRKLKQKRTLTDQVEDLFLALYENPDFQRYNEAVVSTQAVTGHLNLDDGKLAEMIIDLAKHRGMDEVARQKQWTIVQILKVVERRYGLSRAERRDGRSATIKEALVENDSSDS